MPELSPLQQWLAVARVLRPRGIHGEVVAAALSSRPERFAELQTVYLFRESGLPPRDPIEVEEVWEHRGQLVFKFSGIDSRTEAEKLRGAEICVPMADRPVLAEGEYYHSDLIGCRVFEKATGAEVGTVTAVNDFGGPPLLAIATEDGEILLPMAKSICVAIDVVEKRIEAELPDGLRELNRR